MPREKENIMGSENSEDWVKKDGAFELREDIAEQQRRKIAKREAVEKEITTPELIEKEKDNLDKLYEEDPQAERLRQILSKRSGKEIPKITREEAIESVAIGKEARKLAEKAKEDLNEEVFNKFREEIRNLFGGLPDSKAKLTKFQEILKGYYKN